MRHQGNYVIAGNLEPRTTQPLDSRLVVDTSGSLTLEETWKSNDDTIYVYQGMVVSTSDNTPEVWKLTNYVQGSEDYKDPSNWTRIDGSEDYIAWLFDHNSQKIVDAYIIDDIGTTWLKGTGDPSRALSHARGIELRDTITADELWLSEYIKDISVLTTEYNSSSWEKLRWYDEEIYTEFQNYAKDISKNTTDYNTSSWNKLWKRSDDIYDEFQEYVDDISGLTAEFNSSFYREFSTYVKETTEKTEEYIKHVKEIFEAHCEGQTEYNTSTYEKFADLSTNFYNLKDRIQTALVYRGSVEKYGDLYELENVKVGDMWNVYNPVTWGEIKDYISGDDLFNIPNKGKLLDTSVVYTSGTNFAYNPRDMWDAQGGSADGLDTLISANRKDIDILYKNLHDLSTNFLAGKDYTIRWKKINSIT